MICTFVFFFKQKTAYEMRISDWSSDVCSSDLQREDIPPGRGLFGRRQDQRAFPDQRGFVGDTVQCAVREDDAVGKGIECEVHEVDPIKSRQGRRRRAGKRRQAGCKGRASPRWRMRCGRRGQTRDTIRSEEHTSELQSLMRNSYAVFCLTKQK